MSKCCGKSDDPIKDYVKDKYGQIAAGVKGQGKASCCGDAAKDPITADLYSEAEAAGVPAEALLASLGCGNPTALAELSPGEVVLDLGSGGGIDVLLSAKRVGPTGKAYGLDMTDEMLALAEQNRKAAGVENVEFLKGEIESIPLPDNSVDVIISNCVINLSTDKDSVLRESFRVLRPGGRFAVADIVMVKPISQEAQNQLALWAGCIAGALTMDDYKAKLANAGFGGIDIQIVRTYEDADTASLLGGDCCCGFGEGDLDELKTAIVSAFIRAVKPSTLNLEL
jgi:arsenite methyltransferase